MKIVLQGIKNIKFVNEPNSASTSSLINVGNHSQRLVEEVYYDN